MSCGKQTHDANDEVKCIGGSTIVSELTFKNRKSFWFNKRFAVRINDVVESGTLAKVVNNGGENAFKDAIATNEEKDPEVIAKMAKDGMKFWRYYSKNKESFANGAEAWYEFVSRCEDTGEVENNIFNTYTALCSVMD